jgi:diguanylate cyclase (GGDEF)-like protein
MKPASSWLVRVEHPAAPFLGIAALALAATGLRTAGTDWGLILAGLVGVLLFAGLGFLLPWSRLPPVALLILPVAVDGMIALLRQAQGGALSGYGPLAILPVAWVGLTQGRRAVAVISAATGLLFALPIVIVGGTMYPASGWRGVILWTVVAVVMGTGANRVVAEQRSRASFARTHAGRLDRLVEAQAVMAKSDLDSILDVASETALKLTNAEGACIEFLDGAEVVCVGVAGVCADYLGLRLKADETISGECFRTGEVLICTDSEGDTRVNREACRLVGARSLVVVPLFYDDVVKTASELAGDVKGVLIVYSSAVHAFRDDEIQLLTLLASMIGAALGRSALMEQLTNQAVTDELTGLPNRRAWYQQLDRALASARRSGDPLSILILDLDGFKEINDRLGHAAGDRLLKEIAGRWAAEIRTTDLLGRIGGDEFGVILELTSRAAALGVVANLDRSIGIDQTVSIGVALWDGKEDASALVARADDDMYEFKRARIAIGS